MIGQPLTILHGDALAHLRYLEDESINCCVTSPPYFGLRDYQVEGQIGLEDTPEQYIARLVQVFREVRRVLRKDGTLWVNIGDSYAGSWGNYSGENRGNGGQRPIVNGSQAQSRGYEGLEKYRPAASRKMAGIKEKDLIGIPWMLAFALRLDGWFLRQDIIWQKPNPMPESVGDRCTKAHEYLFLLSKSQTYYYDQDAIRERAVAADWGDMDGGSQRNLDGSDKNEGRNYRPGKSGNIERKPPSARGVPVNGNGGNQSGSVPWEGFTRNKRSVWTVPTVPYSEAHFATFPPALIEPCILAGCPPRGKRCDCDEIISTPTGEGAGADPSIVIGRAGMSRPRRDGEGVRQITRRVQRGEAEQMKRSPWKESMRLMIGEAFDHYIRTDRAGARPLPEGRRHEFYLRGWLQEVAPCACPEEPAGIVLDPFAGSGTTGEVALKRGRRAVLIELNADYIKLIERRTTVTLGMF